MKKVLISFVMAMFAISGMAQDEAYCTQDWVSNGEFESVRNARVSRVPQTVAEALEVLPGVPTAEQILSAQAKHVADSAIYQPFYKANGQLMLEKSKENENVQQQMLAASAKQKQRGAQAKQQYNANVSAGLVPSQEEIMQMMMSGEINPNWSEDKIMDAMAGKFAAKWGVSKQEYLTIMSMAQKNEKQAIAYIQTNHPELYSRLYNTNASYGNQNVIADDSRDTRFGQIGEELAELQMQLSDVYAQYDESKYSELREQLKEEWPKSSEASQIEANEAALAKRIDQWVSTLDGRSDVAYPSWFTAERKKQNALVDQWNRKAAQRWLNLASKDEKQMRNIFERIAVLEAENEQLSKQGDAQNSIYLQNKHRINTLLANVQYFMRPYNDAFKFPCVEHVQETAVYSNN